MIATIRISLSAIAGAALAIAAASAPAAAGGSGQQSVSGSGESGYRNIGYFGRSPSGAGLKAPPAGSPYVNIYRGGNRSRSSHAIAEMGPIVTVYGGGEGVYAGALRAPDYVDGLDVVMVTRGAGRLDRTIDGICVASDGHEMPAARTQRAGASGAEGPVELLRCEPGLVLRAFVSRAGSTDGGIVECGRNMSLWSAPNGHVQCRTKRKIARSEAELRHIFGTDPVVVEGRRQADNSAVIVTRGMSFNGGVGATPY